MLNKKSKTRNVFENIIKAASGQSKKIVLPEGNDQRVIDAAEKASLLNICTVYVIGNKEILASKFSKKALKNIVIVDINQEGKKREMYSKSLYELRKHKGMTETQAFDLLQDPMYYATMMLYADDVDGVVAGAVYESAEVMRPAFQIIKTTKSVSKVSSCFIMEMPENTNFGENGMMVFADCAVTPNPTSEQLSEMAVTTAQTARIFGLDPKVAFLSYGTGESGKGPDVDIVKEAVRLTKEKNVDFAFEGPIQFDAAIDPVVAKTKLQQTKENE